MVKRQVKSTGTCYAPPSPFIGSNV